MMTPPATCDSAHSLLMIRPQSCTATILVQRTTPVSVSTLTSAICTPPTPWFAMSCGTGDFASPLAVSMPSRAQASFQDQLLLLALSTTLPSDTARSSFLALSLAASLSKRSSRAATAAFQAKGEVPGQVVLPPEPEPG